MRIASEAQRQGWAKVRDLFEKRPGRSYITFTVSIEEYLELLDPGLPPQAIIQAIQATAIVGWAHRKRNGSITRVFGPFSYRHGGQLLQELLAGEAEARQGFKKFIALAPPGASLVQDHIPGGVQ